MASATEAVFYVLQEAVSRESLERLQVELVGERVFLEDDQEDGPIPCWAINQAGLDTLLAHGYCCSSPPVPLGDDEPGGSFVPLANPDGKAARADIDPTSVKVITITSWYGDQASARKLVEERLIPAIGKHVELRYHSGARREPVQLDGTLVIHLNSSPAAGTFTLPDTVWGFRNHDQYCEFGPWVDGEPILCSEGEEVGAATATDLYIYLRPMHEASQAERVLSHIIDEYIQLHQSGFNCAPDYEKIRRNYVTVCRKRVDVRRRELESELSTHREAIKAAQQALTESIREGKRLRFELDNFDRYAQEIDQTLSSEFDTLLKMPMVSGLRWRGQFMHILTKHVYCEHPTSHDIYDIGKFEIVIDTRISEVRMFNKTRQVRSYSSQDMHAPHVFANGRPCLGTLDNDLPLFISNYNWAPLFDLCIAYLESVNLSDAAGRGIPRWPIAMKHDEVKASAEALGQPVNDLLRDLGPVFDIDGLRQLVKQAKEADKPVSPKKRAKRRAAKQQSDQVSAADAPIPPVSPIPEVAEGPADVEFDLPGDMGAFTPDSPENP